MNVGLEKLFQKHEIGEKDRHEIASVYQVLSKEKQLYLLSNFEVLATKVKKIEQELIYEQNVLLDSLELNIANLSSQNN